MGMNKLRLTDFGGVRGVDGETSSPSLDAVLSAPALTGGTRPFDGFAGVCGVAADDGAADEGAADEGAAEGGVVEGVAVVGVVVGDTARADGTALDFRPYFRSARDVS